MQELAINDHVTTKVHAWYTSVAEWTPPGYGFAGICSDCRESTLGAVIDIGEWPHDITHPLVESLRVAIADVQDSYCEEALGTSEAAATIARRAVGESLARHADDITDVLEQCVSDTLQSYLTSQVEAIEWDDLRRPAAS